MFLSGRHRCRRSYTRLLTLGLRPTTPAAELRLPVVNCDRLVRSFFFALAPVPLSQASSGFIPTILHLAVSYLSGAGLVCHFYPLLALGKSTYLLVVFLFNLTAGTVGPLWKFGFCRSIPLIQIRLLNLPTEKATAKQRCRLPRVFRTCIAATPRGRTIAEYLCRPEQDRSTAGLSFGSWPLPHQQEGKPLRPRRCTSRSSPPDNGSSVSEEMPPLKLELRNSLLPFSRQCPGGESRG